MDKKTRQLQQETFDIKLVERCVHNFHYQSVWLCNLINRCTEVSKCPFKILRSLIIAKTINFEIPLHVIFVQLKVAFLEFDL